VLVSVGTLPRLLFALSLCFVSTVAASLLEERGESVDGVI
jgi:hypothetical protein